MPEGGNRELREHYFGELLRAREEEFPSSATERSGEETQSYAFLANLVVAPEYQRRGVGKLLLESGLRRADELGLATWLDASPYGLGLYKKYGFKEVKTLEFELGSWGGKAGEIHRSVCMLRKAAEHR
jgi:GNAT superfamily N-acetyltransferase